MQRLVTFAVIIFASLDFSLWAGGRSESNYEWTGWRGSTGDGITVEDPWSDSSSFNGEIAWQVDVGAGFSSVAVADGEVYTLGNSRGTDTVYCLTAKSGKIKWEFSYPSSPGQYPGPRSTPAIAGDRLIVLSRMGNLFCFDRDSGRILWSKDLVAEEGVRKPEWDLASSPIIRDGIIYLNVNKAGMALRLDDGEVVWATEKDRCGYASPVFFEYDGIYQVLMFGKNALHGVDPDDGSILWSYPWETEYDVNAADPLIAGNKVFISSTYRRGCALVKVAQNGAETIWENNELNSHFSSFVYADGYIYGNDGNAGSHSGSFKCVDVETGAVT